MTENRIRTIAPEGQLSPVRVGFWVKVRASQGWGQPGNCPPTKVDPWLALGFGLWLVLWLGAIFFQGQLS